MKLPSLQIRLVDKLLTDGLEAQVCEVLKDGEPIGELPIKEARVVTRPKKFAVLSLDLDAAATAESVRVSTPIGRDHQAKTRALAAGEPCPDCGMRHADPLDLLEALDPEAEPDGSER